MANVSSPDIPILWGEAARAEPSVILSRSAEVDVRAALAATGRDDDTLVVRRASDAPAREAAPAARPGFRKLVTLAVVFAALVAADVVLLMRLLRP